MNLVGRNKSKVVSSHLDKPARANCHFFRVEYNSGRVEWIAFDTRRLSDLTISAMKEKIVESEKSRKNYSGEVPTVWYAGKLALWK